MLASLARCKKLLVADKPNQRYCGWGSPSMLKRDAKTSRDETTPLHSKCVAGANRVTSSRWA